MPPPAPRFDGTGRQCQCASPRVRGFAQPGRQEWPPIHPDATKGDHLPGGTMPPEELEACAQACRHGHKAGWWHALAILTTDRQVCTAARWWHPPPQTCATHLQPPHQHSRTAPTLPPQPPCRAGQYRWPAAAPPASPSAPPLTWVAVLDALAGAASTSATAAAATTLLSLCTPRGTRAHGQPQHVDSWSFAHTAQCHSPMEPQWASTTGCTLAQIGTDGVRWAAGRPRCYMCKVARCSRQLTCPAPVPLHVRSRARVGKHTRRDRDRKGRTSASEVARAPAGGPAAGAEDCHHPAPVHSCSGRSARVPGQDPSISQQHTCTTPTLVDGTATRKHRG